MLLLEAAFVPWIYQFSLLVVCFVCESCLWSVLSFVGLRGLRTVLGVRVAGFKLAGMGPGGWVWHNMQSLSVSFAALLTGIPNGCVVWYDGCNTCTVEDGQFPVCTMMQCLHWQPPRCIQYAGVWLSFFVHVPLLYCGGLWAHACVFVTLSGRMRPRPATFAELPRLSLD